MATSAKLQIIDVDAHVVETERTWDYLRPSEQKYRPHLFFTPDDPTTQYWILDRKVRGSRPKTLTEGQLAELSGQQGKNMVTPRESREMADVGLRLAHMDALGIDVQVLHATLWLQQITERVEVESALTRSWNHWLGDICQQGQGRLRWSCVVPVLDMSEAAAQMRWAKDHGAVGCLMRAIEGTRLLVDPYFYPIYDAASQLDMPIVVHISNGNPANLEMFFSPYVQATGLMAFRTPAVAACFAILMSEVPRVFPRLKWLFAEASAQWLPWILHEVMRRGRAMGRSPHPAEILDRAGIYVTCETDDDLPYILGMAGDDHLVIGTDYGHTDTSSEVDAMKALQEKGRVSQEAMAKILCHNAKALFGL